MEAPSQAIRRFSILDSSSDEDDAARAGAASPGSGLDESDFELSLPEKPLGSIVKTSTPRSKGKVLAGKPRGKRMVGGGDDSSSPMSGAIESSPSAVSLSASTPAKVTPSLPPRSPLIIPKERQQSRSDASPVPASFAAEASSNLDSTLGRATGGTSPQGAPPGRRSIPPTVTERTSTPIAAVSARAADAKRAVAVSPNEEGNRKARKRVSSERKKRGTGRTSPRHGRGSTPTVADEAAFVRDPPQRLLQQMSADAPLADDKRAEDENALSPTTSSIDYCLVPKWKRRQGTKTRSPADSKRKSIYERGIKSLSITAQKVEELRQSLLASEAKNATFHPQISSRAQSLPRQSGGRRQEANEEAARLRKRLIILETPCGYDPSSGLEGGPQTSAAGNADTRNYPSFSPRISEFSEKLVRRRRSASAGYLPAGERLYRDAFCRDKVLADCIAAVNAEGGAAPCAGGGSLGRAGSAVKKRSQREIDEHVSALFRFEAKRQEALRLIREQEDKQACERPLGSAAVLHVDPALVVERLTNPSRIKASGESSHRKSVMRSEEFTFAPRVSPATEEILSQARARGLGAWFDYFVSLFSQSQERDPHDNDDCAKGTVSVAELCVCTGPCAEVAWYIASVLEQQPQQRLDEDEKEARESAATRRWARRPFIDALVEFETRAQRRQPAQDGGDPNPQTGQRQESIPKRALPAPQIWREKPPFDENGAAAGSGPLCREKQDYYKADLTFHPKVNPRSETLAAEQKEARSVPAHERLFLGAKQKQLAERQKELECLQRQLAEEVTAREKRERARARWLATHHPPCRTEDRDGDSPEQVKRHPPRTESANPLTDECSKAAEPVVVSPGAEPARERSRQQRPHSRAAKLRQRSAEGARDAFAAARAGLTAASSKPSAAAEPSRRALASVLSPAAAKPHHASGTDTSEKVLIPTAVEAPLPAHSTASRSKDVFIFKAIHELESLLVDSPPSRPLSIDHEAVPPSASPTPAQPDGECASKSSSTRTTTLSSRTSAILNASPALSPSKKVSLSRSAGAAPVAGDLLLECASCRSAITAPAFSRANVIRENRRKLSELGKELYKKQQQYL